ncbi:UNVERIFIED_CONTAM: TAF9 RNA polymerase II, TATA box binding protein (TBP)-associated factor isoform 2 family protein [Hammondia hammondi]|eukprot:XP_008882764.1 TAF9 RNA polymerase II, TATA box binding protein (TBP)-associated factor isoform 2 family protein [Hammondia hammondi]
MRNRPNILVTGTPGVGKTTFCRQLALETGMEHVNVGQLIKDERLFTEWDDEKNCSIFDEDLVVNKLEDIVSDGNKIVDFHSCDFMPDEWFDLVYVLRADTAVLYDRLEKRHYKEEKIRENVECEIFRVLLDEAIEAFGEDKVKELHSNNFTDLSDNVSAVTTSVNEWSSQ